MKHILGVVVMLVAASSFAFSQTTSNKAKSSGSDEQAIQQFLNELAAAVGRNDTAALDRMYADDYTFVNSSGAVVTKAQRLAAIKSGDSKYESVSIDESNSRMYENTAVATVRAMIKGQNAGQDISGQYRVTTMLVKKNGRWHVVAQQSNRITQP